MLDVRRLRVLLAVREHGSIAAAATALSFTPPALSQQLAGLERQLGVSLLDRGQRRVRLTDAGYRLAEHAEHVLASLEAAEADMASIHERWGGALRIGVLPTIGTSLLPGAATRLLRDAPRTELHVEQMEAEESLPALKRGELDVALASEYGSVPQHLDQGLTRYDLLVETVLVALPSDHAVRGTIARLTALADQRWIAPAPASSCLAMLERACGVAGFEPHITGHCGDFTLALTLVEAGLGVALVPATVAHQRSCASTARLLGTDPPVHRTLYLAARRGGSQRPAVQRFLRALTETAHLLTRRLPATTSLPARTGTPG